MMMIILLLFAFACNLDFLLVNATTKNNQIKSKFKPRKHGSDLPLTQEGRIVEEMDYVLENPDMVKKSVVPQDMEALFDFADSIIPGAKALKDPIEKTVHHLIPILKVGISLEAYCQTTICGPKTSRTQYA